MEDLDYFVGFGSLVPDGCRGLATSTDDLASTDQQVDDALRIHHNQHQIDDCIHCCIYFVHKGYRNNPNDQPCQLYPNPSSLPHPSKQKAPLPQIVGRHRRRKLAAACPSRQRHHQPSPTLRPTTPSITSPTRHPQRAAAACPAPMQDARRAQPRAAESPRRRPPPPASSCSSSSR